MPNHYLAPTDPSDFRYAVHCCGYKWDLTFEQDHAVAIFRSIEMAKTYGSRMWPATFEVTDRFTGETV